MQRSGLYLAHKPVGATSFSIVRRFQQAQATKDPVCHGGTLDPFAEGLLLILVGQVTRLMDLHHEVPKTYVAEVEWGIETDTGDGLGRVVKRGDAKDLEPDRLEEALEPFRGWTEQTPPATSAKKIGGEPAYKKAHRGEAVHLPPSRVFLHRARWLLHELPERSRLELTVRGGFYVRALVRDLGEALGCGAHVSTLRRTQIGPWADPGPGGSQWIQGEGLLPWAPARDLTDPELTELKSNHPIPRGQLRPPGWNLPEGFPSPTRFIRAIHQGRLRALLNDEPDHLTPRLQLKAGV
jgi:tRNA pseudouridine55 synthase